MIVWTFRASSFECGRRAGREHAGDLRPSARAATAVAPELRIVFWSGLAHEVTWDVDDPEGQVKHIQDTVPEEAWPALYTGMIATWTRRHGGEPDQALPFAEDFADRCPTTACASECSAAGEGTCPTPWRWCSAIRGPTTGLCWRNWVGGPATTTASRRSLTCWFT